LTAIPVPDVRNFVNLASRTTLKKLVVLYALELSNDSPPESEVEEEEEAQSPSGIVEISRELFFRLVRDLRLTSLLPCSEAASDLLSRFRHATLHLKLRNRQCEKIETSI
jgi:hypothetical protein